VQHDLSTAPTRWPRLGLLVALSLAVPTDAAAVPDVGAVPPEVQTRGSNFAMFDDVRIPAGTVHDGDVVCLFGDAEILGDVRGDVVVVFGTLTIDGTVHRDAVAVLTRVVFGESGEVERSLVNVLGTLEGRDRIGGDRVHIPWILPGPKWPSPFGMLGTLVAWGSILWTALLFVLIIVLLAAAPDRVLAIAEEAPLRLPLAYLAGLVGYVTVFLVNTALAASVLGLPLALLVWAVFIVLKWMALTGIFLWVGRGIGRAFRRELSPLTAVLVAFLPVAVLQLLPVLVGGLGFVVALAVRVALWLFLEIPAVGLALLTRAGASRRAASPPV
jgi:hypothetical protein